MSQISDDVLFKRELIAEAAELYGEEFRKAAEGNRELREIVEHYESNVIAAGENVSFQEYVAGLTRDDSWWYDHLRFVSERATDRLQELFEYLSPNSPLKKYSDIFENIDEKGRIYYADYLRETGGNKGYFYLVKHPLTLKNVPIPHNGWHLSEASLRNAIAEGNVYFGDDHTERIHRKVYLEDTEAL